MKISRRIICLFVILSLMMIPAAAAATASSKLYSDVPQDAWYYTYVSDLNKAGIISGYPDGTFGPSDNVTCGQALKLLILAAGYKEQAASDGHWASGYRNFAVSNRFAGSKDLANLDGDISRQLIAQIAAKALKLDVSKNSSPFADTADGYVVALYEAGIFTGSQKDDQLVFLPNAAISRAEISAVIWRISHTDFQETNSEQTNSHEGQFQYGTSWLDIQENVPKFSRDTKNFYTDEKGRIQYSGADTMTGIDVSSYQKEVDWNKVAADGIDFAIIRLGYRGYGTGKICLDSYFKKNIQGALDAGLKVGVYFFSQAVTPEEAAEEAKYVLSYIQDYEITLPVVFDWETVSSSSGRANKLDPDTLSQCAVAFCSTVKDTGYDAMVYFNKYLGYRKYDLSQIANQGFWLAEYTEKPSFYYDFKMWQYSSKGSVDGISGNVDMDLLFLD